MATGMERLSLSRERFQVGLRWTNALVRRDPRAPGELHAGIARGVGRHGVVDCLSVGLGRDDLLRLGKNIDDRALLTGGQDVNHVGAVEAESQRGGDVVISEAAVATVTAAATGDQEQDEGESREQESHGTILPRDPSTEAERNAGGSRLRCGERGSFATGSSDLYEISLLRPQRGARDTITARCGGRRQHGAGFQRRNGAARRRPVP
jgi:hypothetical protein